MKKTVTKTTLIGERRLHFQVNGLQITTYKNRGTKDIYLAQKVWTSH